MYDVKVFSQDPFGVSKRTEYMNKIMEDMRGRDMKLFIQEKFGMNLFNKNPDLLPDSQEELDLHMQLNYKQAVELAEEQAINVLMENSDYDLIRRRCLYDLAVLGISATKTTFDYSEGAQVKYVDPANLVYSHTESPYFDDLYYVGEVKEIPINELVKEFPNLTEAEVKQINDKGQDPLKRSAHRDKNKVHVLYFNYKSHVNDVYKLKKTSAGGEKIIQKDDQFNPP